MVKSFIAHWIKIPEEHGDNVSGFIVNKYFCSNCKKEAPINSFYLYDLVDKCPYCNYTMVFKE